MDTEKEKLARELFVERRGKDARSNEAIRVGHLFRNLGDDESIIDRLEAARSVLRGELRASPDGASQVAGKNYLYEAGYHGLSVQEIRAELDEFEHLVGRVDEVRKLATCQELLAERFGPEASRRISELFKDMQEGETMGDRVDVTMRIFAGDTDLSLQSRKQGLGYYQFAHMDGLSGDQTTAELEEIKDSITKFEQEWLD